MVLNAANEVAVASFLENRLGFTSIPVVIERVLNDHVVESVVTLELIRRVDAWAHEHAGDLVGELQSIG